MLQIGRPNQTIVAEYINARSRNWYAIGAYNYSNYAIIHTLQWRPSSTQTFLLDMSDGTSPGPKISADYTFCPCQLFISLLWSS